MADSPHHHSNPYHQAGPPQRHHAPPHQSAYYNTDPRSLSWATSPSGSSMSGGGAAAGGVWNGGANASAKAQAGGSNAGTTSSARVITKVEYDDDGMDGDDASPGGGGEEVKKKSTRGSRACTVCRKVKMRCVGSEEGDQCKRCKQGGHECVFEESMRGRRSNKKTDQLAKSLKKMEQTLETVLQSISNPGVLASAGGMVTDSAMRAQHVSLDHSSTSNSGSPQVTLGTGDSHAASGSMTGTKGGGSGLPGDHQRGRLLHPEGVRFDQSGRSTMEWSSVRGSRDEHEERDEGPRLHSLPDNTLNPLGLLAEASLQNTRKRGVTLEQALEATNGVDSDDRTAKRSRMGVANSTYFQPGPMNILPLRRIVIEQRMPPALLIEKIVTVGEVVELFELFFEHCHRQAPFLDPEVHTPTATGSRSPFLFTCICAVAARYYTKRTDDLYRKCLRVAHRVAFDVFGKGFKSTEICQGFLLLCLWNSPSERYEEERTYQFSGIAIRMATDLNLHRKTLAVLPEEAEEETRTLYAREIMNRERTWIYCFVCDRSVATQMGKPSSIGKEDFMIRNSKDWWKQAGALKSDIGLSAMVEMHRIVARILDTLYSDTRSVSGLNAHLDYPMLMRSFLGQLDQWKADWTVASPSTGHDAEADLIRSEMRTFYHSYYRLFLLSFAVQHALDNPHSTIDLTNYCVLCFESASDIIKVATDFLGPRGILRYGMDSTFVYLSYAATFLLKLVSPTFSHIVDEHAALSLVNDVADTLERCAVDDSHTPALYASFLRALTDNKRNGGRTAPQSRAGTRPSSPAPGSTGMEAFLKSRANSMGPDGDGEAGAFDTMAMDSMLSNGAFWNNMLMPGFGGPLAGLSGGTGMMLSNDADPWSVTPLHSRAGSPTSHHHSMGAFDFAGAM